VDVDEDLETFGLFDGDLFGEEEAEEAESKGGKEDEDVLRLFDTGR
jgi:hypothetical protein